MSELAERLQELASRNGEPLPDDKSAYTEAEAKDVFLGALEEGKTIPEAAALTGRSASWFRARRRRGTRVYDPAFAELFEEIMSPDGPNRENLSLRAFTALVKACEEGNVRAAEKILAAYHADFHWLRPAVMQGNLNIEQLQVFFGELPLGKLLELKEAREQARLKELPIVDH